MRIVVTGMGLKCSAGDIVSSSWSNLLSGKPCLSIDGSIHAQTSPRVSKFIHFANEATKEAILDSNLNEDILSEAAVIIGSGIGGLEEIQNNVLKLKENNYIDLYGNDYRSQEKNVISAFFLISSLINLAPGNISINYKIKGLSQSIVSACASGAHAIIEAVRMIKLNEAKVVVAGGSEACVCPIGLSGFNAMKAVYNGPLELKYASMPFDQDRAGFVMSEGAGILIIEEYEHALKRNAKIYAEIKGYGCSSDATHVTKPSTDGAIRCMKKALQDIRDKVCINAHATSTHIGDQSELDAIYNVFNDRPVYVTANKSAIGHTLGASGAIEAIFSILSLQNNIIPMTYNLHHSINTKDNVIISNQNINAEIDYVLSNSFGFGGTNASILFAKLK